MKYKHLHATVKQIRRNDNWMESGRAELKNMLLFFILSLREHMVYSEYSKKPTPYCEQYVKWARLPWELHRASKVIRISIVLETQIDGTGKEEII